jgi:hypothetical protein
LRKGKGRQEHKKKAAVYLFHKRLLGDHIVNRE